MAVSYSKALQVATLYDAQLRADDPRFRLCVHVLHKEGTTMFYRHAFARRMGGWFMIHTEHHGFHVYDADDVTCMQLQRIEIEGVSDED